MDITKFTQQQMNSLRKVLPHGNHCMVFMWRIGLGRAINIWPAGFGRILVVKHRGRKSGKEYLTPINYAIVEGEIYCTAGYGPTSDWYRKSNSTYRLFLLRQVIIASGFAGPLFGVNPKKLNNEQLNQISKNYRLVHFAFDVN
jgi:hypothetical protein